MQLIPTPVLRPYWLHSNRYGKAGRFYNLDPLGDSPQTGQVPAHLWNEAEQAALRDPVVHRLYQAAMKLGADNDAWEPSIRRYKVVSRTASKDFGGC
jgi:hypothetical protein